jgi:hypothetical protein
MTLIEPYFTSKQWEQIRERREALGEELLRQKQAGGRS